MDKDDVLGFAKKALPWIGAAATGNIPALVAMAAAAVGDVIGVKVDADTRSIAAAIQGATPEQLVALKQADNDFAMKMRELGYKEVTELAKIDADDRNSARRREVDAGDSWTPRLLSAIVLIGWFVVQGYILTNTVDADMREIVMRSLGTLDMALGLVLGYYFGSSSSSRIKDAALAKK